MGRPGLGNHPKFRRAMRLLAETRAHIRGHLELLWEVSYECGRSEIGDTEDIELAADWQGEPGKLCKALLECGGKNQAGFIEEILSKPGRYQIHNLYDHCPEYVRKRMDRELARQRAGKTLSEIRAEAAHTRWKTTKPDANAMQTADTYSQLLTGRDNGNADTSATSGGFDDANGCKCHANGTPPSPTPTPTPKKKTSSSRRTLRFDPADKDTAAWMFGLIQTLDPNHKRPNLNKWANEIRLMRDLDGRTDSDIRATFAWANQNSFWRTVILSPGKLREKYDQLTLKRKANENGKPRTPIGPGQRHAADRHDQVGVL